MTLGSGRDPLEDGAGEVRFHLERQVEDLMAEGWSEAEARAEARRRFGDPERIERRLARMKRRRHSMETGAAWWDGTRRDIGFALRQIRRKPGFASATAAVLALGVGMAAAVFAVVDAALIRPLPYPQPDQLVAITDVQDSPGYPASFPEFEDWERETGDLLTGIVAIAHNQQTLQLGDLPEHIRVGLVAGDLEAVTGLHPIVGRYFAVEERAPAGWEDGAVLVDEDFWRTRLAADPGVVGRMVEIDGAPVPVVGVIPREARLVSGSGDVALWRPLPHVPMLSRGLHLLTVVGRLSGGVDVAGAVPRMESVAAALRESAVTRHGIAIRPLREALLGDTRRVALILAGAAVLVLLVVCANLAHLFLARGWARTREFAVRGALGAGRGRLVRQLLAETTLLGLAGGVGGVLVARGVTGWVARAAANPSVAATASATDPRVVGFALLTSLVLGLLFGWVPARRAAGADPGDALRGGAMAGSSAARTRLRRLLVGVEVALSAVLLTGAGLLVRTVDRLVHQDTGFSAEGILTAEIALPDDPYPTPESRIAFWDELTERVRALPGVQSVALFSHLPFRGDTNGGFEIVGRDFPEGESPQSKKRFAGPGLFEAMGIPLLRGRAFLPTDRRGEPQVAVISEAVAERYWPGEDPIGRHIRFGWQTDEEQEIVGVVRDVRSDALDIDGEGTIYLDNDQIGISGMAVVIKTAGRAGAPDALAEPLRRAVQAIDPHRPVSEVRTLDSIVRESVSDRTTVMQLLGAFAALALLLAALGVYAVAAQSVFARTREIGLRMAIGARPGGVVRRVVREEIVPVVSGLVLGVAGSVAGGRVLSGMLYEVSPTDFVTLASVDVVLLGASALALAFPALRAMHVDPVVALRSE